MKSCKLKVVFERQFSEDEPIVRAKTPLRTLGPVDYFEQLRREVHDGVSFPIDMAKMTLLDFNTETGVDDIYAMEIEFPAIVDDAETPGSVLRKFIDSMQSACMNGMAGSFKVEEVTFEGVAFLPDVLAAAARDSLKSVSNAELIYALRERGLMASVWNEEDIVTMMGDAWEDVPTKARQEAAATFIKDKRRDFEDRMAEKGNESLYDIWSGVENELLAGASADAPTP